MSQQQVAPAGWYPHPSMVGTQRYWDGSRWTDHIAPMPMLAPMPMVRAQGMGDGVLVVGYITAIFIPVVGFIIGIVAMSKGRGGHGAAMLVISIVAFMFWLNALTPDTTYSTYNGY
ncbi:DUF2510 domain-containing protein [Nocardioides sp. MH1]|uniref:DUF2510 domain-containing protein n=1 Tax=Nocardioides sp. MH1 TaxID=3242490 RepID=UPI003522BE41